MGKCKFSRTALVWMTGLCLLTACQEEPEATDPGLLEHPVHGGTAVVAFGAEPDVLNPLIRASAYTGQILALLMDSLMEMGEDLLWYPKIARDYQLSPDGMTLTYRLRPWSWSDGVPLSAYDFAESFQLMMSPEVASPRRGHFASLEAVTALDSFTLRYEFNTRVPDPVGRSVHFVLPVHRFRSLDRAEIRSWPLNENPLACGPFALEKWTHNFELVLQPNQNYPDPGPLLDRVVFRIIPDETSRVVALETGAVDFMEEIPIEAARRLEARGDVLIHRVSGRLYGYLVWNFRNPIFADKRVRKAISLGIDRSRFVEDLLKGYATAAASPIPPGLWGHHRDLSPDPFDPERARELLAEAGWRDVDGDGYVERNGTRFEFEILTRHGDPVRENGVVIIRENLRQVGIMVRPRVLEHATSIEMLKRGEFDAYLGLRQANMYMDPSPVLHSGATDRNNFGNYRNARVDSLLERALALFEPEEALPVWYRLQEVVAEDLPMAFLYYPDTLIGVNRRLQGVRPHILSPFNNINEWWIAPADRKYATGPAGPPR